MKSVCQKTALLTMLVIMGGGCTMLRPPVYDVPPKSSLVAGDVVTMSEDINVYAIAQRYNVSMREIISLNDMKAPLIVRKGQSVTLPSKTGIGVSGVASIGKVESVELAPISTQRSVEPVAQAKAQNENPEWARAPQPVTKKKEEAQKLASEKGTSINKPRTRRLEAKEQRAIEKASFKWPVDGKLLSVYGEKGNGVSNDGINIVAPKDAPVVAAAQGTVVYAGNEMKGYGNLVLIRHENDWVTAYAHLDRIWVAKETVVGEGAMIGTVGSSGGVKSPQLHFETRFDGNPIDPELVLQGR